MNNNEKIIKLYLKSKDQFNLFESTPRDFGTGDLLYSSEIHTLVTISKNRDINLTELANKLDISKSGTSKFIKKLLCKNLISKNKLESNQKEVIFNLTKKGAVAVKGHEEFKHKTFTPILKMIDSLADEQKEFISQFLYDLNQVIKNLNK